MRVSDGELVSELVRKSTKVKHESECQKICSAVDKNTKNNSPVQYQLLIKAHPSLYTPWVNTHLKS